MDYGITKKKSAQLQLYKSLLKLQRLKSMLKLVDRIKTALKVRQFLLLTGDKLWELFCLLLYTAAVCYNFVQMVYNIIKTSLQSYSSLVQELHNTVLDYHHAGRTCNHVTTLSDNHMTLSNKTMKCVTLIAHCPEIY